MNKMTKLLGALLLLGSLASCNEIPSDLASQLPSGNLPTETQQPSDTQTEVPSDTQTVTPSEKPSESVKSELEEALVGIAADKTSYLTTVGQADSNIVSNIFNKAGATGEYTLDAMLNASDVEEGAVVFLTLGASSKGLGAAGVDEAYEKARAKEFSDAAKEGKFTLILFHVGGTARRGSSSDPIIEAAFPGAAACFVVSSGNEDGFFNGLSTNNNVSLYEVSKSLDLVNLAKGLYGKE